MSRLRATAILAGFAVLTLPLMPVQALLLKLSPAAARRVPHWYHRRLCRLLGVRLHVTGSIASGPLLMVANHTSWLDIPVLSALAPLSFIAKSEVATWPFVKSLARLQRTVFVDRARRLEVGDTAGEIAARLAAGDTLLLFPEGTSSDGNRVLAFRSALFGAVLPARKDIATAVAAAPLVQPVTLAYTRRHGLPLTRSERPFVGWYGDMEMGSHAWQLLQAGPLDVEIVVGPPMRLDAHASRKELALATEVAVREALLRLLLHRDAATPVTGVMPERNTSSRSSRPPTEARKRRFT